MQDCLVWHNRVGGVTVGTVSLYKHSRTMMPQGTVRSPEAVARDATTVLSHSTFGHHFRPKLAKVLVQPLMCVNLGSKNNPYYHGGGLLPGRLSPKIKVLTPVLNSGKHDGQWGLRCMSVDEVLRSKDVTDADVKALTEFKPNNDFLGNILPGKCLLVGFDALTNGGG